MKILPPTLRNKKRYLAIEIDSEKEINRKELIRGIWNNALSLFGDHGTAKTGLWIHEFDGEYSIVECNNQATKEIEKLFSQIYQINNKKTRAHILGISGSINKLKKKFIQPKNE